VQPIVLDTDVASLLHRRKLTGPVVTRLIARAADHVRDLRRADQVSRNPPLGSHRREELAGWLSGTPVLPDDEAVGAVWGRLPAAAFQRGRPRPVNDMWIAACCLAHEVRLATVNLKDFEDFKQHHGLRILGAE
jgi:hypothetical protein